MSFSQLDYCQYLLSSPNNYTLNNLANHLENVSHDTINRYLTKENFTSESDFVVARVQQTNLITGEYLEINKNNDLEEKMEFS